MRQFAEHAKEVHGVHTPSQTIMDYMRESISRT